MDTNTIITAAPSQYEMMLNNYASIVEKTNNQLGFWTNLSSLAVAILSVIIAVIAIAVAFAIWKNSKEQKDKMIQFFSEQEKIIKEKNTNIEKIESKFDKLISEYENKLKDIGTENKESKKQVQQVIDELKKEKISASAYLMPASGLQCTPLFNSDPGIVSSFGLFGQKSMSCFKCGKSFKYHNNQSRIIMEIGGNIVYCPYCGASNIEQ
jgi:hypothetical protein